ncbi:MAG: 4'-phosphopantetheinyl transferase family protein [Bacteroidales bacterium]
MPYLQEISSVGGIRTAIWQITETAEELLAGLQLTSRELDIYVKFSHELRKRQWLAYRALLKHMLAPLPASLHYDNHGKPCLDSGSHYISASHAGEFAAVACSKQYRVGIDIERIRERVERVKERFLQEKELEMMTSIDRLDQLYIYWGGKEALYKLHGTPDVDFRNDIYIHPFDYLCNTDQNFRAAITSGECVTEYSLVYRKIGEYMLVMAYGRGE